MPDWFAIVETATGRLISTGTVIASPLRDGLEAVNLGTRPPDPATMWDEGTKGFANRPTKVQVDRLDDLHADPDFGPVYSGLRPPVRATVDAVLTRLLGAERFRNSNELPDLEDGR